MRRCRGPCPTHTRRAAWGAWGGGAGRDGAMLLLPRGADAAPGGVGAVQESTPPL